MTTNAPTATRTGKFTPALLILFAGSGCAALVYEVVWFHLLRLVVGSSAISLAFLLGSFMGGMCLGSLLLPRLLSASRHPLRVYAALELGIGAIGIALPYVLPRLGEFYTETAGGGVLSRGLVCATALLLPTILMGATLPAIARWMDTSRSGIASLGLFYGANIVGAVIGTLLAGFYLLRVHDIMVATWFAVAVNALVAIVALALAGFGSFVPVEPAVENEPRPPLRPLVYVAIGLSGFTALGAEVIWTRLLSLLFGASVYTFSLILAVFLIGLGIGSGIGSRLALRSRRPRLLLGACQLLLVPAIAFSAFMITTVIPYGEPTYLFQPVIYENALLRYPWDFFRCTIAILPAPVLWGASFPLALAAAGAGARDPGRLVGGVYAANTIGAIGGALLIGLFAIGGAGTQQAQQLLVILAGATGLSMLATAPPSGASSRLHLTRIIAAVPILLLAVPGIAWLVPATPKSLIAYGRTIQDWDLEVKYLYLAEGVNASVAVTELEGFLSFHVSGKVVASTERIDMRLQRMLGHLPGLIHPKPKNVLIVGCGAGVTAGTFTAYPSVERIVICEIEPQVIFAARTHFGAANSHVLDDPRTEVVIDDGRHFLATTDDKFDIITSDPIHPWVRGAAALYSAEYYDLVKQHLEPHGIVTQWVPLYQTDESSVKSQVGTFMSAFPFGSIWNSDLEEYGYDIVMMAQNGPMTIDVNELEERLKKNGEVGKDMDDVDLGAAIPLLKTYAGQAPDLRPWLEGAEANTDASLRLQYLAGLALDIYREEEIFGAMKKYVSYPDNLFVASQWIEDVLREALSK